MSNPDNLCVDSSNITAQDKQKYIKVSAISIWKKYFVQYFDIIQRKLIWFNNQNKYKLGKGGKRILFTFS